MAMLFEHGVLTEGSDIRAHVGFRMRSVYIYETRRVHELDLDKYKLVGACQPGVKGQTAQGWLVPPEDIPGMVIKRPCRQGSMRIWLAYHDSLSTTEKGRLAVAMVEGLMRVGHFPLWIRTTETTDRDIQIKGTDIIVTACKRVQVKCDWKAGAPYLFLQKSERNPLHLH